MKKPAYTLFLLPAMAAALYVSPAMADNTLRGHRLVPRVRPHTQSADQLPPQSPDSILLPPDTLIELSGYDKPLRSRRETMLVTNRLGSHVTSLTVTITYLDLQGRQLHEATVDIPADIPPGATRMVSFPSWDRQLSYYYHLGQHPRTPNVTPYTVTCVVRSVTTPANTSNTSEK
ncbi:MAG: hypothetical protein HFJ91_07195 [Muribaculaceae bacterium]|nr:hypothetical protein [Muribaculaceae bacterium]